MKKLVIALSFLPALPAIASIDGQVVAECTGKSSKGKSLHIVIKDKPYLPPRYIPTFPPAYVGLITVGKTETRRMYLASELQSYENARVNLIGFITIFPTDEEYDPTQIIIRRERVGNSNKAHITLPHKDFYSWETWEQRRADDSLWQRFPNAICTVNTDLLTK